MARPALENRRDVRPGATDPAGARLLPELLEAAARRYPGRSAVVCDGDRLTFAELADAAGRLAAGIAELGIGRGDAVALLLPNGPSFATAFFALAELGAVSVPLNPKFKEAEVEFCLREAGVRAVIADPPRARLARRVAARLERDLPVLATGGEAVRGVLALDSVVDGHRPLDAWAASPGDAAVYQYSSGATGRPKRVARTHRQLAAEVGAFVRAAAVDEDDGILCALPLFHSYGLGCCLLAAVASGATLLVVGGDEPFTLKRRRVLSLIGQERPTVFPGVPLHFRLLAEARGPADLSSLRLCLSAAAPLPLSTYQAVRRRFGLPVRQLYGTTETGALTLNLDDDPDGTALSVGRPLEGVEIRVLTAAGEPLEPGRIGGIAVRGPGMTEGYAGTGLEKVNRRAFRDGYFLTGDRGRLDEEGRLFITGRTKLLIDVRGDKVDPIEVEDVIAVHPRVREVVVVGVPGEAEGEELIKAVIVPDGRCDEREVLRFCSERLANYKVPHRIEFRESIPRSAAGAVLRKYLVD